MRTVTHILNITSTWSVFINPYHFSRWCWIPSQITCDLAYLHCPIKRTLFIHESFSLQNTKKVYKGYCKVIERIIKSAWYMKLNWIYLTKFLNIIKLPVLRPLYFLLWTLIRSNLIWFNIHLLAIRLIYKHILL